MLKAGQQELYRLIDKNPKITKPEMCKFFGIRTSTLLERLRVLDGYGLLEIEAPPHPNPKKYSIKKD